MLHPIGMGTLRGARRGAKQRGMGGPLREKSRCVGFGRLVYRHEGTTESVLGRERGDASRTLALRMRFYRRAR